MSYSHRGVQRESGVHLGAHAHIAPACTIRSGTRCDGSVTIKGFTRIGRNVLLGNDVTIGEHCLVGDGTILAPGTSLGDAVQIGPRVIIRNEVSARAVYCDGTWAVPDRRAGKPVTVGRGATIQAGAIVNAGVTVGRYALVDAGAVVSQDVPDHGWVAGNPARLVGQVCSEGHPLQREGLDGWRCATCGEEVEHPAKPQQRAR